MTVFQSDNKKESEKPAWTNQALKPAHRLSFSLKTVHWTPGKK